MKVTHQREPLPSRGHATRERRGPNGKLGSSPGSLHPVLVLQAQVGNAQIARLLAQRDEAAPTEDEDERKRLLQASADGALAQRQPMAPDEDEDERKRMIQPKSESGPDGGPVRPALAERIDRERGGGSPLDAGVRGDMEQTFATKLEDVRIHVDGEADALSRSINARAFTIGRDVFFRQGTYEPGSAAGRALLSHELTHVLQQRGLSQAGPLTVGPAGDQYEQQADAAVETQSNGDAQGRGEAG